MTIRKNERWVKKAANDVQIMRGRMASLLSRNSKARKLSVAVCAAGLTLGAAARAEDAKPKSFADSAELTLDQLVNIQVTSVSKKEEKLNDAAAAISVLSNDDIRRSGATTVADALRLVPGLQVASINASTWAISARGFNDQYANKLLVMIDGRSVYTPQFGGTFWDAQQVMLEDVDRIEVIRGPGATIWGANAVNGVINIVTRSAKDTQGGLIYAGGGDALQAMGGARYGGKIDENTYYRVYGEYQMNDDNRLADGQRADDAWRIEQGGFRIDHYRDSELTHMTWQGDVYMGNLDDHKTDTSGFNTIGRWTRQLSDRSTIEAQAYFDYSHRADGFIEFSESTIDLSLQHTFGLGEYNDLIWGIGYRFTRDQFDNQPGSFLNYIRNAKLNLFSAFVQDEIKIVPDKLTFTIGTKLEHNDYTGFELEPSIRVMFKPEENQTLWAAVSRAVRTPSELEGGSILTVITGPPAPGPGGGLYLPMITGNPDAKSEVLLGYELGYRIQPTKRVEVDIATFYNLYSGLLEQQPVPNFISGVPLGIAQSTFINTLHGETYGGEASLTVSPVDNLRFTAGYSLLLMHIEGEPSTAALALEQDAPTHQFFLRSAYDFTSHASLDAQLRYVDNVNQVPAYLTADVRLSYRPVAQLEFALVGQNLLDSQHPEHITGFYAPASQVPRGFYGKITWHF
jgi:iron complex outermembrane receptor protein